ncbi:UNVERIFIED_CONTAM: hypothetical protein HDU68_007509 [Siphonaria sp. JEL0065]|nr:hypothetical protein HDU68_007509 [Siphonaria sp. JEL0065]
MDYSLHDLLLQNLLDLKSEFNHKADIMISLLGKSRSQTSLAPPLGLISKPLNSSYKSHLDFGIRWDGDDYSTPIEANLSSIPQLFKFKVEGTNTASGSKISITESSEFIAFRQKKGLISNTPNVNGSQASMASYVSTGTGFASFRNKGGSQKRTTPKRLESITMESSEEDSNPHKYESFLSLASSTRYKADPKSLIAKSTFFGDKEEMIKSQSSGFHHEAGKAISRVSKTVKGRLGTAPSKRSSLVPSVDETSPQAQIFQEFENRPPLPPSVLVLANSMKRVPLNDNQDQKVDTTFIENTDKRLNTVEEAKVEIEIVAPQQENQHVANIFSDLFSYVCLIPSYDSKGVKITLDQFDESDFEGMSFLVNGLHPKSHFTTWYDVWMIGRSIFY